MTKQYKTVLAVRFFGYFIFFTGLIVFIFIMEPLFQEEIKYRVDRILGVKRTIAQAVPSQKSGNQQSQTPETGENFANIQVSDNEIVPVSTEYGIVIEKINANAKVIPNINPVDEKEYVTALKNGVAEALGGTLPGQPGNVYLFSHSTDAPWNIIRFNAIFYLLKELEPGDRVIIFYRNIRYDYIVFDKVVASPKDVSFLTNRYNVPVLTLQTCDPPGTLINRLIVRAKLVNK